MVKILIHMDGGIIQGVASDEDVEIYIADYDVEGVELDHPHLTKFDGDDCLLFKFEPGIDTYQVELAKKTWETV